MSKHAKYSPKHRGAATPSRVAEVPQKAIRTTVVLSSLAVAATGASVAGGVLGGSPAVSTSAADLGTVVAPSAPSSDGPARSSEVSRDSDRTEATTASAEPTVDPAKAAALSQDAGPGVARTEQLDTGDPRSIAQALLGEFGFSADQFGCLDSLWTRESGWRVNADNPSSSAYGIPQALPGSKMASAGPDWATNPETQIRWGLGYIQDRYGSPCGAWSHSQSNGWY